MKEKIEAKIDEVLDYIMSKDASEISYNEYRILDNKLASIKWETEKKEKDKEFAQLMSKTLGYGLGSSMPTPLPEPTKED